MTDVFQEAPALSREDHTLIDAYRDEGRPVDDLPYTEAFERIFERVRAIDPTLDRNAVFRRLLNLRKAARLPQMGRRAGMPVSIGDWEEELLADLIPIHAGTTGRRDRLPYTSEFDSLANEFNKRSERNLSRHDIWKLLSRIAK